MSIETPRFYAGSDHAGIELRQELCGVLESMGGRVIEVFGPADAADKVDYPDVAVSVCRRVLGDAGSFGLLVCGSGQGMAMTANRFAGIRAAVCSDAYSAKMARAHNDANVLCLGQRVIGGGLAASVVEAFVRGRFEAGRHVGRVAKLEASGR